ncbi:MAG: N-acetylmuramoyl-L-alanine amidase [bacterium]|nr:N-acetylmuramoyl-L-alanine amidase [bacterium]
MKNIAIVISFSFVLVFGSFSSLGLKNYKIKTIVIDAGHGGKDPGTSGIVSKEKDVALSIALELGRIIKEKMPDVEVVYTRDKDTYPTLSQRANLANKKNADLFVSIHCNANPNHNIYGSETYVMGNHVSDDNLKVAQRENSVILREENYQETYDGFDPNSPESYILFSLYQSAYQQNSVKLAQNIQYQFKNRVNRKSRGVKSAGFLVLWRTTMPSVLVEVGFLSNQKEEKELNDKLNQVYIASGIYRAFRDYKTELEN